MPKGKKRSKSPEARLNGVLRGDDAYREQRRLESAARTRAIEQRMAQERGELMDRKEKVSLMVGQIQAAKRKYELVRRKVASRYPDTPAEVLAFIEELHREALRELSRGE